MARGDVVDETGMLLRDGGGFVLHRDRGGRWRLDLSRVPVDLVGKRVRVAGIEAGDDLVDVDGVQPG
ncbi:MAG: hypothetical protein JWM75_2624 [Sphingomonas bacterium]|nr:hypothetical protein [Sphingomonas bacterium]